MKEVLCFIYDGFADFETVLTCSAIYEEKQLEKLFGEKYLEYKKKTPKWIPR